MMRWSKDLQLSPVADDTEAGSVPVPLRPKSVEDTCKIQESVQDITQPVTGIFKRENSILVRILTNLGVADGAIASLCSYAGAVILVGEVESAGVVVRLDESCRT